MGAGAGAEGGKGASVPPQSAGIRRRPKGVGTRGKEGLGCCRPAAWYLGLVMELATSNVLLTLHTLHTYIHTCMYVSCPVSCEVVAKFKFARRQLRRSWKGKEGRGKEGIYVCMLWATDRLGAVYLTYVRTVGCVKFETTA